MFNFNKKKPISEIPYFYSQNLIDEEYYKKLSNNFPKEDLAVGERLDFQNSRIRIRNKNLENHLSRSSDWNAFCDYLLSEKFINYVFNLFDEDFYRNKKYYTNKNFLKNFINKYVLNKKKLQISIDISLSGLSYFNKPHTDRKHRMYVMLIYFCDQKEEGMIGGEFVFHSKKNQKNYQISNERFYENNELKILQTIPPLKNSGVIFKNNDKAIHSVNKITSIVGKRKFCYVSIDVQ